MGSPAPDPPPNAAPARRAAWVPPAILAVAGFSLGLFGNVVNAGNTVMAWFRPPPLPAISEEYLMVKLEDYDLRIGLQNLAQQVKGLRVVMPRWLDDLDSARAQALQQFCEQNEATLGFADPADPARAALVETCLVDAHNTTTLIGSYAIRSFDPKPVAGLGVDLAVLTAPSGVVDAYDGFISGEVSADRRCFVSGIGGDCMADWAETEHIGDLPVLGPGEMLLLPIFFSFQFLWRAETEDGNIHAYDGLAPTPFRFPVRLTLGARTLIEHPRAMRETPSLQQGFYEGRG